MSLPNSATSYGDVAKFFHWLIATLIIIMLVFGYFLSDIPKAWQSLAYDVHKLTGLTILTLMALRLGWALSNIKPSLSGMPVWQQSAARVVHYLLYLFALLMPLAGWVGSVAAGYTPELFGIKFGLPIAKNKALSQAAFDVHDTTAIILIVLISLHVLAALYHHFIEKDDVLLRMLPGRRR